ncbi:MAG: AmmeMemoRadiSam system protein A [Planctomycetes bacterium]|nr:AmmeMemoRadiSam system protein A [Planctomycetota bacterium]
MTENARKELLRIARETAEAAVRGKAMPKFQVRNAELLVKQGAFVTIKNRGELRGCIGRFTSDKPLAQTVADMAVASATEDSRFFYNRVTASELAELDIEISVLSPMQRVDDPLKLELGKHGIYIRRGSRTGCFLPQVATETGWSKEEFLSRCCGGKAGLPPDAWRDPGTEVYLFTAEVFGEHESGTEEAKP